VRSSREVEAFALRYGVLYGLGTGIAREGAIVELVRKRLMPIVGDRGGIWPFIHVHDVACATVAALTRGSPGLYNVVDDEPAPVSSWLPALSSAVGAKAPRRMPLWLARLLLG
jgi:nucleoside-diphosphate-sugar epimerase